MNDYIRRAGKFILYLAVIFTLVLVVYPLIIGQKPTLTWDDIIHNQRVSFLFILLFVYSLAYPFIAFTKLKRHINGTYAENRELFNKAFETYQYEKTVDTPEKVIYRRKSRFIRFIQWYEDSIVIIPHENPVIISGMRKAVTRIDKMIDQLLIRASE